MTHVPRFDAALKPGYCVTLIDHARADICALDSKALFASSSSSTSSAPAGSALALMSPPTCKSALSSVLTHVYGPPANLRRPAVWRILAKCVLSPDGKPPANVSALAIVVAPSNVRPLVSGKRPMDMAALAYLLYYAANGVSGKALPSATLDGYVDGPLPEEAIKMAQDHIRAISSHADMLHPKALTKFDNKPEDTAKFVATFGSSQLMTPEAVAVMLFASRQAGWPALARARLYWGTRISADVRAEVAACVTASGHSAGLQMLKRSIPCDLSDAADDLFKEFYPLREIQPTTPVTPKKEEKKKEEETKEEEKKEKKKRKETASEEEESERKQKRTKAAEPAAMDAAARKQMDELWEAAKQATVAQLQSIVEKHKGDKKAVEEEIKKQFSTVHSKAALKLFQTAGAAATVWARLKGDATVLALLGAAAEWMQAPPPASAPASAPVPPPPPPTPPAFVDKLVDTGYIVGATFYAITENKDCTAVVLKRYPLTETNTGGNRRASMFERTYAADGVKVGIVCTPYERKVAQAMTLVGTECDPLEAKGALVLCGLKPVAPPVTAVPAPPPKPPVEAPKPVPVEEKKQPTVAPVEAKKPEASAEVAPVEEEEEGELPATQEPEPSPAAKIDEDADVPMDDVVEDVKEGKQPMEQPAAPTPATTKPDPVPAPDSTPAGESVDLSVLDVLNAENGADEKDATVSASGIAPGLELEHGGCCAQSLERKGDAEDAETDEEDDDDVFKLAVGEVEVGKKLLCRGRE